MMMLIGERVVDVVVVGSVAVLARRGRSRSTKETGATLTTVEKKLFFEDLQRNEK